MLLCVLVTLSTVVASDIDDTNTLKTETNTTDSVSVSDESVTQVSDDTSNDEQDTGSADVLSASSDEEVLGATGTFSQLYTKVNSGYDVTLDMDYATTYSYTVSISRDNYVLDGAGHTLDGGGVSRIFSVSGTNVTLKNIIFKNGYVSGGNCGGAIYSSSSDINIINCTFESNTADYNSRAGAIYFAFAAGAQINIINSSFYKNRAAAYGGAICFDNQYQIQGGTDAYIKNCNFSENRITTSNSMGGGAILVYRGIKVYIYSSNFYNNTATSSEGGAIRYSGDTYIYDSKFISNNATHGGALCFGQACDLIIYNTTFEDNHATLHGGAVKARTVDINLATFTNNTANYGGAVLLRGGSPSILNSEFTGNNATVYGGAIAIDNAISSCSIANVNFENNAAAYGGAVYFGTKIEKSSSSASTSISGSTFVNNIASVDGGALCFDHGTMFVERSSFDSNNATVKGGAVYVASDNGAVSKSSFTSNYASLGGAVYWDGDSGSVQESTFTSNLGINGTSIYWAGDNGNLIDSTFTDTSISLGSVYWHGSSGTISGSTFYSLKGVYLCSHSSVNLTSNTQYSTSQTGYAVYNAGTAQFYSNTFKNLIYNYGIITSSTYLVTLDNITHIINSNSMILYTSVEDDNGNYIYSDDTITMVYDSTTNLSTVFNNTHYIATITNIAIGLHNVTALGYNSTALPNLRLKNGAILYLIMNLTVNQTNYGEKVTFTVEMVNTTLNGTVVLYINGDPHNVTLVNGTGEYIQYNMAPNTYVVIAEYTEYNQTLEVEVDIEVRLRNSTIVLVANNVTYGNTTVINITCTNGTTGTVYVFVNSKMYTLTLINSTAQLNLTNLPGGNYTAFAVYNGDGYFEGSNNYTNFTVSKIEPYFIINADNITVGQTSIISVDVPSDITGTIYVYVDSTSYVFSNSDIVITAYNLTAGNHTVRVVYDGGVKYMAGNNTTTFNVGKKDITMSITTSNIKVSQNETIIITVPSDATGIILIKVNDEQYYVYANNTKANLTIAGLAYGTYSVNATYLEDDSYYSKIVNSTFKVDYMDIDPNITYEVDDDLYALINVTIPTDVTGDMLIEINGQNYTIYNNKGLASVTITNLTGGEYPAKFYLENDSKYGNATKSFTVILNKISTRIHISAPAVYVDENATITVTVVSDATGNVTIKVNNMTYTQNVTNGTAVFTIPGLPYGSYDVYANYSGDRKYSDDDEDEILVVNRIDPSPYSYMNATSIYVGENATINITMPSDLNGTVNLTIQGKVYSVNITNGHGQIIVSNLTYGIPVPIYAEFAGNEKYLPCERTYTGFSVHRFSNYDVVIEANTTDTTANITVSIPDDANGPGYITVTDNGTYNLTQQVTFVNGTANITATGLSSGQTYVVYAYFDGDDKYTPNDAYKTLNSNKTLNYTFEISANDIYVGETVYVIIYLPNATVNNDTVTIKVHGQTAATITINDTTVSYPIYNLAAGSHQISVTYNGNDEYDARSRYTNISVSKINPVITGYVNTPYVGENLTFTVTLPTDLTGNITITINQTSHTVEVVNGTAVVIFENLSAGNYDAWAFYSGDDKYNNRTQYFNCTVLKIKDFNFTMNVSDISVGQNETIWIYLPDDINGNVTITIANTTYTNVLVTMTKGVGVINITDLATGKYYVYASLSNDTKYDNYTITGTFTVATIGDYLFNLTYNSTVYVRDNITFILELPDDANGTVNLTIFNKTYLIEVVNGIASINNITATSEGVYSFIISFEQDGVYDYKSQEGFVVVSKKDVDLTPIYNSTVDVDENITFIIVLPSDATGNVTITSRGITFNATLVNGSANLTMRGYPVASVYSPMIYYTGDDKYNSATYTSRINVTKVSDYDLNVTVGNISYGDTEVVNITLPSDATEDVIIYGNFSSTRTSVLISNGTAQFNITGLAAGTYNITVLYQGYDKYESKNVTKTFTVRKITPEITIEFINNSTLLVTLPSDATGTVNITAGNITQNVTLSGGIGILDVSALEPGTYNATAYYYGDDNYYENNTNISITLPKLSINLPLSVENITLGENATITVTLPSDATGYVNITIDNGSVIQVSISQGKAVYNATGLKVGNHTVVANYSSDKYNFVTNSTIFNVGKITTVLSPTVSVTNRTVNITVGITENATGNITIYIDGTPYSREISDNKVNLVLDLIPGEYVITTSYSGNENYTSAATGVLLITIDKITDYNLTIELDEVITVIQDNTIIVTVPENATGYVYIDIGTDYESQALINTTTHKATFVVSGLLSGNYTVIATFSNELYDYKSVSANFTVIKLNTTIDVEVNNITKDLSEIINVTLNENATGNVLINVSGDVNFATLVDGKTNLTLSNLAAGNYTVTVTYLGDNYFNVNVTQVNFTVSKIPVNITVSGSDIIVGQDLEVTVKLSEAITDVVTVNINNTNYTVFVYKGEGNFTLSGLSNGTYTVTAYYAGDDDYVSAQNSTVINVTGKNATSLIVKFNNITVGETAVINVTVEGAKTGYVTLAMAGNPQTKAVTDGFVQFEVSDLDVGKYHLTVVYIENDYYLRSNASADLYVFKKNSTIAINVSNIYVGDTEVINATVNENATGYVLININGTHYYADIVNGTAQVSVKDLGIGIYNVTATYIGDSNYNNNTATGTFNVSKHTTTIVIESQNITYGQAEVFTITTSANITEVVTINVGGRNYSAFVENGVGTYSVYGLTGGNYTATVYFPGNSKYEEVSNTTNFTVSGKEATSLNVTVNNITVGEDEVIYVNVTGAQSGNVTLTIAGNTYTKEVVNGSVNFTLSNLNARDYHITVIYLENDYYLSSNATAEFTVNKKNSTISLNVTDILIGDVEVINVTVSENATGYVLININGTHYYAEIVNGSAVASIEGLNVNYYYVIATYLGDNNYYGNSTDGYFNVTKRTTAIVITSQNITYGLTEVFTITTSANFTEVVTITIGNDTYTTYVENGTGSLSVYGLNIGNYTAYVYFPGNTQYYSAGNSTNFTVSGKKASSLNITVSNITVGDNATIHVNVTNGTTGYVTVVIAGNAYTELLNNSEADFTISGLSARDYHITVYYLGDDYYLISNNTAEFSVNKKDPAINITVSDIEIGSVEIVNVTLPADATGYVLISIENTHVYAEIVNGTAIANISGLAIGRYNVTATYIGDSNYNSNSTNASFNVTKSKTSIVITGQNITVGQVEVLTITTSANFTEVITIRIGDNNYTTYVENGTGTLEIAGLEIGNYTAYVYFPGNTYYDLAENSTNFTVSAKKPSNTTVTAESITVGDTVTIYVNVTSGATGYVNIAVGSEIYTLLLNNSKANLTLANLSAGSYHVIASYLGDEYYLTSSNSTDFTVSKKASKINVTANNITIDQSATVDITITNGTSGVVLIDINGTDYYANIENGTAQLVVKNLAVGNYTVIVIYNGDSKYNASSANTTFTVTKLTSEINVTIVSVSPIAQGNDVLINVTGPSDVTGVAIVSVNATNYTVYINNGIGQLIISKPSNGTYSVVAVYQENYKYLSNTSSTVEFEVYVNETSLDVETQNIYVGETENITVTIAGEYDGNVTIYVDGNKYNASLTYNSTSGNSTAVLQLAINFTAGIHQVNAVYVSNKTGVNVTHEGSSFFIVSKNNSTLGIDTIVNITVGLNATIQLTLLPSDANGTIDVYVNGEKYTVNVTNKTLIVPNLTAGSYIVQAMYSGDDTYLPSSANASFTVSKNNITIELNVSDIEMGETEYINVTLESDAFGYVLININGTNYYAEVINGTAKVNVTGLVNGTYSVNATFIGDDKYYSNSTVKSFNVTKREITITINGTDIYYGQSEEFTIKTSANITEVVTIEIVGVGNYTTYIVNGTGTYSVGGLDVGSYTAYVYFPGNTQYGKINSSTTFNVKDKKSTSMNVSVANITVGDDITVYVNTADAINGTVYVTIAGVAYTETLVNGKVNFTVSGLKARDYTVSAFFMGNDEFEACNATSNFTVNKKTSEISINTSNIHVGETAVINVTITENTTGVVLITIAGLHVYAEVNGTSFSVSVPDLALGSYNVTATYLGDENHTGSSANTTFNVTKLTTAISIIGSNITVGQVEVLNITISANFTEVVTITIGNITYTTYVQNGTGTIGISGLSEGNYTAYVYFPGNTYNTPANASTNFTVTAKLVSAITVEADNISAGENATIYVNVTSGATGNVTIVVGDKKYTKEIDSNGKVNFTVENLTAGDYHVTAYYLGDTYYLISNNETDFSVNKKNTPISASVTNSTVGSVEYVNVTVDENATGTVLLNIGGSYYYGEIDNGVAKFNISGLDVGNYTAYIRYLGDDIFNENTTEANITISNIYNLIFIKANNITVGQVEVFTITTAANITSVVTVELVGFGNFTAYIVDGQGTYSISGLAIGNYTANVYFNGNNYYGKVQNTTNFTVSDKKVSAIDVSVSSITVGETTTVYVNVTNGATGEVAIVVAGNEYTATIDADGKANFTLANLTARDYHVTAYYRGDEYYWNSSNTAEFTVYKKNTNISATVTNSTVGSVEYINVTLDDGVTGTVLLSIDGSHYYATITDNVAYFNITGLGEGEYTAYITYEGNGYYNSNNTTAKVKITKLTTEISITGVNITVDQYEVFNITTSNFTEVVTIEIVGVDNYTAYVINGTGTFTVPVKLAEGTYTAYVYFPGNTQYSAANSTTTFTVSDKKASAIDVSVSSITVGETTTVYVNVTKGATGEVAIVVAGNEYTATIDADGKSNFTLANLTARDYHVTAYYRGDEYYWNSSNTAEFTVYKKNTNISATVTNSTVGSVEYINVTLDDGVTGTVLLSINGSQYYATIVDNVAYFNITGLGEGEYIAYITYEGNDYYNSNNTTAKVKITRLTTEISITGVNITVDQYEVFNITTSNFTEVVTIEIVGVDNYTAYVINGTGTFTVPVKLAEGTYTAYVYFPGNTQYSAANSTTTFTVSDKKASAIDVSVSSITVGETTTVYVNVTKGATGEVAIVVAGKEHVATLDENGKANFTLENLTARHYHVTAYYRGDEYYWNSTNTANFTVTKLVTSVDLNVSDITEGEVEYITVNVTAGATGVVLINVSGTCYYAELDNGQATFKVAGLTYGKYDAIVIYQGDEKYNESTNSKSFIVKPLVTIEAGENNGTVTPLTVKVSDNATGNVTVVVDGVSYNATVTNGTATVYVVNATPGEQNVTVIYSEEGLDPIEQNVTADIPKVTGYDVEVSPNVIKTGNSTVTVTVPEDATGNVTMKVGNLTITQPVENGTATFDLSDLPVGLYDAEITYDGDDKYASTTTHSPISHVIDVPTVSAVDHLIRGWNSQFDYEAVFTNEYGEVLADTNVTFIVNGKSYTVQTESHGIARLSETLAVGNYTVISINPVTGENITKELSIVPRIIYNEDLTMEFMDGSYWTVLVIGDDGNPVGEGEIIDIYVNTIHYVSKTDKNGYAALKINLNPKTYKISAEYKNYYVVNKLVVKQTLKLVKKTVKVKKGKKLVLKAKLKWASGKAIKGKKIVFKFKGKNYKAKTNSKGIAKVTIKKKITKKLKKGKKYAYSAKYIKNKVKGKVKVK